MSTHIDADGECPLAVVPCKYHDFGCKFKVFSLLFFTFGVFLTHRKLKVKQGAAICSR